MSSTPASTPSATTDTAEAGDTADEGSDSSVDWDALVGPLDEGFEEGAPAAEVEKPAATAAVAAPAAKPAETAAPAASQTPPVVAQPAADPAKVETPPAQPPAKTREQQEAEAKEQMDKFTGELEKHYSIPEDMAAQLQTEPEVVIPKLLAKAHIAVAQQVLHTVGQQLPMALAFIQQSSSTENKAKEEFYAAWPELKGQDAAVMKAGAMFRQLNPNGTKEQAIAAIGELVAKSLGIQINRSGAPAAATTTTPPAARGHRPASPGGASGGGARPPSSGNAFEQLADEFLNEDDG